MNKNETHGITASVYRDASTTTDFTNGGLTSRVNRVVIIGENHPIFEADEKTPAVRIIRKTMRSTGFQYVFAQPVELDGRFAQFGGNYIACSDSRVREICGYPIPVHDRIEGYSRP